MRPVQHKNSKIEISNALQELDIGTQCQGILIITENTSRSKTPLRMLIVYIKGPRIEFSKLLYISVPGNSLILANCLPMYLSRVFQYANG